MDIPQDAQIDDPTRPQGVWRLRRMFLTRPPRAAKTALSPVGTSQGDRRLRTTPGSGRVLARQGREGEKGRLFQHPAMIWRSGNQYSCCAPQVRA